MFFSVICITNILQRFCMCLSAAANGREDGDGKDDISDDDLQRRGATYGEE
jgi:hypothetical protein